MRHATGPASNRGLWQLLPSFRRALPRSRAGLSISPSPKPSSSRICSASTLPQSMVSFRATPFPSPTLSCCRPGSTRWRCRVSFTLPLYPRFPCLFPEFVRRLPPFRRYFTFLDRLPGRRSPAGQPSSLFAAAAPLFPEAVLATRFLHFPEPHSDHQATLPFCYSLQEPKVFQGRPAFDPFVPSVALRHQSPTAPCSADYFEIIQVADHGCGHPHGIWG